YYIYAVIYLFFLRLLYAMAIWLFRLATLGMVIAGSLISFPLIWQLADMIMACMAITYLTAILLLSPVVYTLAGVY
ncbi:alanine:cation symporter family protein, partial [Salmonella enterica]|uniref:alanine:cation symporter family protein n=1 Tax=Salmonella enterica TaxID=28901 RepID=UPI0020C3ABEB